METCQIKPLLKKLLYHFGIIVLLLSTVLQTMLAQEEFSLQVEPAEIYALPPLHSYAHAQYNGKWLILGGQTSEDEDFAHANLEIIVVDPEANKVWMMPSEELFYDVPEVEQLTTCYAQYYQENDKFYLLGGYGYSSKMGGYRTFPYLTVIDLKGTIENIIAERYDQVGQYIRQVEDEYFGVMEGFLTKVKDEFYLIGGVEFYGFFDEENPYFSKVPKRDILTFELNKDRMGNYKVKHTGNFAYSEQFDEILPTYAPQVFPDGKEGISIFSNAAKKGPDFASWMDVFGVGYAVSWQRNKKIPHYHSTVIPIYDKKAKLMHTIFLGGCDDYLCDTEDIYGALTPLDSVVQFTQVDNRPNEIVQKKIEPFVNYGRDAKFLMDEKLPKYKNGVIKLNSLKAEKNFIGYIFGGASSVNPMIFQNGDILSLATNQVFKVYLRKESGDKPSKEKVKTDPTID